MPPPAMSLAWLVWKSKEKPHELPFASQQYLALMKVTTPESQEKENKNYHVAKSLSVSVCSHFCWWISSAELFMVFPLAEVRNPSNFT